MTWLSTHIACVVPRLRMRMLSHLVMWTWFGLVMILHIMDTATAVCGLVHFQAEISCTVNDQIPCQCFSHASICVPALERLPALDVWFTAPMIHWGREEASQYDYQYRWVCWFSYRKEAISLGYWNRKIIARIELRCVFDITIMIVLLSPRLRTVWNVFIN